MPVCKNCGARLEKFHKDMCPVCGQLDPFSDTDSETNEYTQSILVNDGTLKGYKPKNRINAFFFSLFLGIFGAPFFYVKRKGIAIITLIVSLLVLGGIFALGYFLCHFDLVISILLPIIIALIFNIVLGLYFLYFHDLKDGDGNLMC